MTMRVGITIIVGIASTFGAGLIGYGVGRRVLQTSTDPSRAYIQVKSKYIVEESHRVPAGKVLLIGDSMAERTLVLSLCGEGVFHAGISGARAADIAAIAGDVIRSARPSRVFVAMGVKEAKKHGGTPEALWTRYYEAALAPVDMLPLTLVSIMPVENGKKLGNGYFEQKGIDRENAIIRELALKHAAKLVPPLVNFETVDGVHSTRSSAQRWTSALASACHHRVGA